MFGRYLRLSLAGAALLGFALTRPPAITASDQEQPRLDQPAPIPAPAASVVQTFVAQHDGLSAVELLAVVYPGEQPAELTARLTDAGGLVAERTWSPLAHNAPLRLDFAPQTASAGQTYALELSGPGGGRATAWAHSLAFLPGGHLRVGGQPHPGSLRLTTTYTLIAPVKEAVARLTQLLGLLPFIWLLLFAPGQLLLGWLPGAPRLSGWARLGLAFAASVSLLPLFWMWSGLASIAWSPRGLTALYLVVGAAAAARGLWALWRERAARRLRLPSAATLAMAAILLLSTAVRLLAVRDLSLPAWVDSPHHALIVRLMMETGQVPAGFQPLLPGGSFYYHFGVHALFAAAAWLTRLPLPDVMLWLGQVLNALMPLAVYTAAELLTGRRGPGLIAAAVVGLIAFFPAYYVAWGRYSQLLGLLLLAHALGLWWRLLHPTPETPRLPLAALTAIICAGLMVAHYRAFIFFLAFAAAALLVCARGMRAWGRLAAAFGLAGLLALPWLARLWSTAVLPVLAAPEGLAASSGYNDFPVTYFHAPLERGWLVAAACCLVWGLLSRRPWMRAVGLWIGLVFALINLGPGTWLVNNNSWAISLFLPAALALGWGAHRLLVLGHRALRPTVRPWLRTLAFGLLLAAALVGGAAIRHGLRAQLAIVNPTTVLASAADREALDWMQANLPTDALILVNGWDWQGGIWASPDGGGWIMPITGHATTLPPLSYTFGPPDWRQAVEAFNRQAAAITDADTPATLDLLATYGVTHIYLGARGGQLRPEMFAHSPNYQLLYTNGAAWVFGYRPAASP